MIGLAAADSDRMLTEQEEFDRYWQPACELLADHGTERLREAFTIAAGNGAVRMKYVATIVGRLQREQITAAIDDPDLASSELDGYTGTIATAPTDGEAA